MRCDGNVFDSFQTVGTNDVLRDLWPAGSFFLHQISEMKMTSQKVYKKPLLSTGIAEAVNKKNYFRLFPTCATGTLSIRM